MKIPAQVTNSWNSASSGISSLGKHASDGLNNTKKAVGAKYDQFVDTKSGKRVNSFINAVKKVCNVPVQLVKNHPKATIAAGLVVTLIGGVTANLPALGIGISLLAVGVLAQSANRHAQMQDAMANLQQGDTPQPGASKSEQPQSEIPQPPEMPLSELPQSEIRQPSFLQAKRPRTELASGSYTFQKA